MIGRYTYVGYKLIDGIKHSYFIDRITGQLFRSADMEMLIKQHNEETRQQLIKGRKSVPPFQERIKR